MLSQSSATTPWAGFSDADYRAFTAKVQKFLDIRLADYKEDQMRRRIMAMAKQASCDSFQAYFAAMQTESHHLRNFLGEMTINVTELMRNPALFEDLSKSIFPELIAARRGLCLNVWSAGCSYGAEAYTLAMLLSEVSPAVSYRVRGTDLDLAILAKANAAMFSSVDMASVSEERRQKHFLKINDTTYMPSPNLRRNVSFGPHDLLGDDYPSDSYDLILCRNVLIYFTDEAKDRIYRNFWKALRPNGILFVGGTERISTARQNDLELVRPFFYRAVKTPARVEFKRAA